LAVRSAVMGRGASILLGSLLWACSADDDSDLFESSGGNGGSAGTAPTAGRGGRAGSPSVGGALSRSGAGGVSGAAAGRANGGHPGAGETSGGAPSAGEASGGAANGGELAGGAGSSGAQGGSSQGGASGGSAGQSGMAECGKAPCGGDPVGTWAATTLCVPPNFELPGAVLPGCDPTIEDLTTTAAGTLVLRADGTYESDRTFTFAFRTHYGLACFGPLVASPSAACALIARAVMDQGGTPDCTPALTGCDCNVSFTEAEVGEGSYEVSGLRLSLGGTEYDFCVSGESLWLTDTESSFTGIYTAAP
jgi:hypothetical protein